MEVTHSQPYAQSNFEQVAQGLMQPTSEYLQGWGFHNFSGPLF